MIDGSFGRFFASGGERGWRMRIREGTQGVAAAVARVRERGSAPQ
ncbi:MAG: hypothetical protein WKF56_09080 [Candidatus Limnocylindrales bacterium]